MKSRYLLAAITFPKLLLLVEVSKFPWGRVCLPETADDAMHRALSLIARALSNASISLFFYEDRRPTLIVHGGVPISKAAALSHVTAIASAAMTAFIDQHYRTAFPHARVRTAAPAVTNKWITDPTTLPPADTYRLFVTARLGILPANANRQPRHNNPRRYCALTAPLSRPPPTPTPLVHDTSTNIAPDTTTPSTAPFVPHLAVAAVTITQGGRSTCWVRERSLSRLATDDAEDADSTLLWPDLYHLDHHRHVGIRIPSKCTSISAEETQSFPDVGLCCGCRAAVGSKRPTRRRPLGSRARECFFLDGP